MRTRSVMARVRYPLDRQLPQDALRSVGFTNTFHAEDPRTGIPIATAHIDLVENPENPTMAEMQGRAQRAFAMLLDVDPTDPLVRE